MIRLEVFNSEKRQLGMWQRLQNH